MSTARIQRWFEAWPAWPAAVGHVQDAATRGSASCACLAGRARLFRPACAGVDAHYARSQRRGVALVAHRLVQGSTGAGLA